MLNESYKMLNDKLKEIGRAKVVNLEDLKIIKAMIRRLGSDEIHSDDKHLDRILRTEY